MNNRLNAFIQMNYTNRNWLSIWLEDICFKSMTWPAWYKRKRFKIKRLYLNKKKKKGVRPQVVRVFIIFSSLRSSSSTFIADEWGGIITFYFFLNINDVVFKKKKKTIADDFLLRFNGLKLYRMNIILYRWPANRLTRRMLSSGFSFWKMGLR